MGILKYSITLGLVLIVMRNNQMLTNGQSKTKEIEPEFLSEMPNVTVARGRDVSFICTVDNLGSYRVAWIKSDSKAILGIHTHMVSLNPRLTVSHNGHNTWKLSITRVQLNDSGTYMCQINTNPMRSLSGTLKVVVPPDILNQAGPEDAFLSVSNEGGVIQLVCNATGVPKPNVVWRREGGKNIVLRGENREKRVIKSIDGTKLILINVQRSDMGGYLCIASNGVPPSVSKRFDVYVHFPPSIKAVNQLVAAPLDSHVTLECIVEAFPKPLTGWYRDEDLLKVHGGPKYNVSEIMLNAFTWQMNLTIHQLSKTDFGAYICSSINALGKNEARIRFQELRLPRPKTTAISRSQTTAKTSRKQTHGQGKGLNEVYRPKQITLVSHTSEDGGDMTATHRDTGHDNDNIRYTFPSAVIPSSRSPGILTNGAELSTSGEKRHLRSYDQLHIVCMLIYSFF